MPAVTEGELSTGLPYLRLGSGPPLLVLPGLSPEHANPTGARRRMSLSWAAPFAQHFTVYLVNRKVGLTPGATLADIARDYAGAIEQDIGQPVMVHGTSTGGSVALQLAIGHPELVRRLVLAAAACRLSPDGLRVMTEVARLINEGDSRRATALLFEMLVPRPMTYAAHGAGWLAGGLLTPDDPSDMLTTIAAENSFDAEPELGRVQAPTLVLGGTADRFYTEDLFRRTAAGITKGRGRLVLFPGKPHGYPASAKLAVGVALGFLIGT